MQEGVLAKMEKTIPKSEPHTSFTKYQIYYIAFTAAWAGLCSPISNNIYLPALNSLAEDLNVSSSLINLTIMSYMIFQGVAPMFVGDFADVVGRRPAYIFCFVLYTAANIGLALQNNYAALFILRCMQSSGSSATVALSSGVVSDIATADKRGSYIGFVTAGTVLGPSIGPVVGGLLSQYLGWRAIFWFLTIMGGVFLVQFLLFFPETSRRIVGNGSLPPQKWNLSAIDSLKAHNSKDPSPTPEPNTNASSRPKFHSPNPLPALRILFEKDTSLLLFINAILFAGYYDLTASMPYLLAQIYNYNDMQVGLCYIPIGAGCFIAAYLTGYLQDWNFRRTAHALNIELVANRQTDLTTFPIEQARVQVMVPPLVLGCLAVIGYGWAMHYEMHVAVPLVILFFCGLLLSIAFDTIKTLLVDYYPEKATTATAANNLCRCWLGAGATALIVPMIDGMGRQWCFTFLGLVMLLASAPVVVVLKFGPRWREERRLRALGAGS
ncbi:MFS general substrate transporter [Aspergillus steynii IBT 23096]|uniref:MFS general substrate transporter n=1 Tax=Aspergillus steynii IBT 23096 TaxID=1392250 RepID=A0A2I2G491_9EURO|nr:MFS general substrate transporter [Aspergillus steynii IBT 23096]PLB47695.1 MFS general substrate transporter [Aspergillus steynii IBT 23096]